MSSGVNIDNRAYWYNFAAGAYEHIETPSDFSDYIPQHPSAKGLYSVYLEMGKSPIDAVKSVLESCVPSRQSQ